MKLKPEQLAEIRERNDEENKGHYIDGIDRNTETQCRMHLRYNNRYLVQDDRDGLLDHITALEAEKAELTRGLVKLQRYMRSEQDETHLAAMYEDELGIWVSYLDLDELLSKQEQE